MKIFDCFMFSDEKMLLDIRLNVLNDYVDEFIIVESKYKHNGDLKDKVFDLSLFTTSVVFDFVLLSKVCSSEDDSVVASDEVDEVSVVVSVSDLPILGIFNFPILHIFHL